MLFNRIHSMVTKENILNLYPTKIMRFNPLKPMGGSNVASSKTHWKAFMLHLLHKIEHSQLILPSEIHTNNI